MKNKITLITVIFALLTLIGVSASCGENKSSNDIEQKIDYVSLLGKSTESEEVKKFISTLGTKEIENSGKNPHWMYTKDGVELSVTTENTVHAIFLVKKSAFYSVTFSGYLPYGLKMSDTRDEVEKKLGAGEIVKIYGDVQLCWKEKNLQISFTTRNKNDMSAVVGQIQFRTW